MHSALMMDPSVSKLNTGFTCPHISLREAALIELHAEVWTDFEVDDFMIGRGKTTDLSDCSTNCSPSQREHELEKCSSCSESDDEDEAARVFPSLFPRREKSVLGRRLVFRLREPVLEKDDRKLVQRDTQALQGPADAQFDDPIASFVEQWQPIGCRLASVLSKASGEENLTDEE